ncbi:MAG: hypothetical protein WDW36_004882 [Sanguina aurantia]
MCVFVKQGRAFSSTASASDKEQQQLLLRRVLRETHAAEVAAVQFFQAQATVRHGAVDALHFRDQEVDRLKVGAVAIRRPDSDVRLDVEKLVPKYQSRPSILLGVMGVAGATLGALSAAAPRRIGMAVTGAVQDALTEHFEDQLRSLREGGVAASVPDVRTVLRKLRDAERAPHGAPVPPDLITLQQVKRFEDIGVEGAVGAAVKAATTQLLALSQKL